MKSNLFTFARRSEPIARLVMIGATLCGMAVS
jgi:hypothetical protein